MNRQNMILVQNKKIQIQIENESTKKYIKMKLKFEIWYEKKSFWKKNL